MSGPGMWMPKQKSGKNWSVDYTIVINGESNTCERKFRVKEDAAHFVTQSKRTLSLDERVTEYTFKVRKL